MRTSLGQVYRRAVLSSLLVAACAIVAVAQPVVVTGPSGGAVVVEATAQPPMPGQPTQPGQPPAATSAEGEKKDGEAKPADAKPEDNKSVVNRPDKPPTVPDPKELQAKPDKQGRIQFSFSGQGWPDVMQWLANVSGQSLDWQELPSDYLNLTTQHSYTLPEARDLINRHLQARGYTSLLNGEVLSIFKIDKLDPSLVPRVAEEELYDRQPHDWVKVSFQVPEGIEVVKAAEDVKQVLSAHAKVLPLASTKRLLLIDAVANLRDVSALLNEERLAAGDGSLPKEFVLKHRRAEKVIDILYVILGLDPASRPTQMDLQLQQQKLQLLAQMQQGGKDVASMLQKDGPPVYLAFNRQNNSILANAPKEQLKIIERSIQMLDVPTEGEEIAASATGPSSFAARTPKSYKLKTINPNSLVSTLEEIGDLDPLTELRADDGAKIVFARASSVDHERIAEMIEQLDDTDIVIEIFRLRKHPADAVAGTITALMGKEEKKEDSNRRPYYYSWGQNDEEEEPEETLLKVDADVENNRLIVRGTTEQMAEVRAFLTQMGELGNQNTDERAVRVLDGLSPEDARLTLERLRAAWPGQGAGELIIRAEEPLKKETPAPAAESTEAKDRTTSRARDTRFQFADDVSPPQPESTDAPAPAPESNGPAAKAPPVTITITNDGRLVLSSDDAAALEQVHDLMETLAPPPVPFKEFPLKYISALTAYANLGAILKDELEDDDDREYSRDWWSGDWIRKDKGSGPSQLSKRRKLVIDYDTWTNSILVRHGTTAQLAEIGALLEAYDQPPRANTIKSRRTEAIKVHYSKASVIAAALKEVYRDLLSSRDKEFDSEDEKRSGSRLEGTTVIRYSVNGTGETKETLPLKAAFEGALAVGADDTSNTLVISAQTELFDSIVEMVRILDEQARPQTSTRVVQLNGNVNLNTVRQALGQALGGSIATGQPQTPQPQVQPQEGPSDEDRERRERRRRDRDGDRDGNKDSDSSSNNQSDND
ncbi:MAG: secretin N-terminal domain-containing protein [Pirellulales bacterium]